jgi:hypothetical protein
MSENEFEKRHQPDQVTPTDTLSEAGYGLAHQILSQFTERSLSVDDVEELAGNVIGVGRSLDTVIRMNGERALKRGIDNPGERYLLQLPLNSERIDKGHFIATTDGTIISLFEKPREGNNPDVLREPPESNFLTLPVDDMVWKQPTTAIPAIKIGTSEKQFPAQQPNNGLLQQVYVDTLRQGVEKVVKAARKPQVPS